MPGAATATRPCGQAGGDAAGGWTCGLHHGAVSPGTRPLCQAPRAMAPGGAMARLAGGPRYAACVSVRRFCFLRCSPLQSPSPPASAPLMDMATDRTPSARAPLASHSSDFFVWSDRRNNKENRDPHTGHDTEARRLLGSPLTPGAEAAAARDAAMTATTPGAWRGRLPTAGGSSCCPPPLLPARSAPGVYPRLAHQARQSQTPRSQTAQVGGPCGGGLWRHVPVLAGRQKGCLPVSPSLLRPS